MEAYLDIETTGLSFAYDRVTVVGISVGESETEVVQLVSPEITAGFLQEVLEGVEVIYTYNGSRFDLPFLQSHLGIDLGELCHHHDLMYDCWTNRLFGGLKVVELTPGIPRTLKEVDGKEAIRLWERYERDQDHDALRILLEYNKEDVVNLKALKRLVCEW
ncbi:MAG: ribonuclease H-like domain-containing protein [Chloroflexota bacterium]